MMRSRNPILNKMAKADTYVDTNAATYKGIGIKTGTLLTTTLLSAAFSWLLLMGQNLEAVVTILSVSGIVALISVMVASFVPRVAAPFSILYTFAQGFTLGTLTYLVEVFYMGQGLSLMAVIITLIIFGVMLALYTSRTIRVTSTFRKVMFIGIISILLLSIVMMFIPTQYNIFANNPTMGIALSLFLIIYGAFMLVLNFNQAEMIVTHGVDKRYEWSVALGLMITLIWIYVEVLRLLVLLLARRD